MIGTSSSSHNIDAVVMAAAVLLLASIVASKAAGRFGVPALLLFVAIGMLAGSEGIGGIYFDDFQLAHSIGVVALIFILFGGGLDTHWRSIKPVLRPGIVLATIGVVITGGLVALFAHYILKLSWTLSALLGSIVSSTDAAAVFSVLRARGLRLKKGLMPLLELESGSNDPMAVFLTIGITTLVTTPGSSIYSLIIDLFVQMIIGGLGGIAIGLFALRCLNSLRLNYDGLYPVFTIGIALFAYAAPQLIGGNGYLAVYAAGVTVGSSNFTHRISLISFHDALGWLTQIAMFLCLGLLIYPSHLLPEIAQSLGVALFLMLIARPLAVWIALLPFKYTNREVMFLAWGGLRGAVPVILAIIPVTFGVPGSEKIFDQVFFIVLVSVLVQGMAMEWVARKLRVVSDEPQLVKERKISTSMLEVQIPEQSPLIGKSIAELALPRGVLLTLLTRAGETLIPNGGTLLQSGDLFLVSHHGASEEDVRKMFFGAMAE